MVLAFVDAGSTLGVMAAGSVVPLIVAHSSWHLGWMSLGILGMVLGVVDFIMIRSYPRSAAKTSSPKSETREKVPGPAYRKLFGDRRFWFIGLAYLFTGFAVMVPFTFISTYAMQERAFSYNAAPGLVTLVGAAG